MNENDMEKGNGISWEEAAAEAKEAAEEAAADAAEAVSAAKEAFEKKADEVVDLLDEE